MSLAVEIFLMLLFLGGLSVAAAWVLFFGLMPASGHAPLRRSLLFWSFRGLLVPIVIWALMNIGLSWNLQPYMPQVQAAQNDGSGWFPVYLRVVADGLFVICTYWTAVTLGWALVKAGKNSEGETRAQFRALCLSCFLALLVPAVLLVFFGGWSLLGLAGIILLAPMAGYGPGTLEEKRTAPMYARAIARMKFGKYSEAEDEIIRELEKCEDDFEGWMMLANLYANQFNDLPEAEQTILEICEHPKTTSSQLSIALHHLSNWQLKTGDPTAARRTLQMVCDRLRGTHLAHMAQLRINQIPGSAAELRQQQSAAPIPMPALGDSLDEAAAHSDSETDRRKAAETAKACVQILNGDPNNVSARERLARLFAEHLDQPELGIEQATLLLDMPDQPELRRAEWLGLIAAWQIRYRHDADSGRMTLNRLIREFPKTQQAFAARRRLQLLDAPSRR
ncbi:MAG: hypothetical protein NT154_36635 [Verrucomicrobia bacterium]|nr:hypothetical protein [Verrucomicrobiota bacterium]